MVNNSEQPTATLLVPSFAKIAKFEKSNFACLIPSVMRRGTSLTPDDLPELYFLLAFDSAGCLPAGKKKRLSRSFKVNS